MNNTSDGNVFGVVASENDLRRTSPSILERRVSTRGSLELAHNVATSQDAGQRRSKSSTSLQKLQTLLPSPKHFLQGVQVHNFLDVMNLPDPPTPDDTQQQSLDVIRRRRRRLSSPAPSPLCDMHTNSPSPLLTQPQQQKKKRRTSLCHVASPLEGVNLNANCIDPASGAASGGSGSHCTFSGRATTKPLFSSSSDLATFKKPPRSRRRTSLCHVASPLDQVQSESLVGPESTLKRRRLLPPSVQQHAGPTKNSDPAAGAEAPQELPSPQSDATAVDDALSIPKKLDQPDASDMVYVLSEVRSLVHAYTSNLALQKDCERQEEAQALLLSQIRRFTGYIVTPPVTELPETEATNEHMHLQNRRKLELWMKMGPDLKLMDQYKQEVAEKVQEITGARFDKHRGSYRYFDTETNHRISAEVYEHRYLQMLEATTNPWAEYFERLRRVEQEREYRIPKEEEMQVDAALHEAMQVDNGDDEADALPGTTLDSENAVDMTAEGPLSEEGDEMILPAYHASIKVDPPLTSPNDAMELTAWNNGNSQDLRDTVDWNAPISIGRSVMDSEAQDHQVGVGISEKENAPLNVDEASATSAMNKSKGTTESPMLLPLPSRDETSTNPAIAKAEERLWTSIDAALEIYSREVLDIRRREAATSRQI
jgi:hypothetical protein